MSTIDNHHDGTITASEMDTKNLIHRTQDEAETRVGIIHFVNNVVPGFAGTLKQRYTDFLVNEITRDGNVVHLTDDNAPSVGEFQKAFEANSRPTTVTDAASDVDNASIKPENGKQPLDSNNATDVSLDQELGVSIDPAGGSFVASEQPFELSSADEDLLTTYFGVNVKDKILDLHKKVLARPDAKGSVLKSLGAVSSEPIPDRSLRGKIHADVRRIFRSRIDTQTGAGVDRSFDAIILSAMPKPPTGNGSTNNGYRGRPQNTIRGQVGWDEIGGQFLHFTLYKENKDTMEVISFLARLLGMKTKDFNYSGTKDRRAVTVQRVSVYRRHAKNLARLNPQLRGSRLGNFTHEKTRLDLGDHSGNHFVITLKDCHFKGDEGLDIDEKMSLANQVVKQTIEALRESGFINYFGLQRFGTFGIRTDEIGAFILKGHYKGAVDAILAYNPDCLSDEVNDKISRDDYNRAKSIDAFRKTGNAHWALQDMPRKFSAEIALIRFLSTAKGQNDYLGALNMINRNLKTMYVHAYQSFVWNMVASKRWEKYGAKVIKGDLVLTESTKIRNKAAEDEVDENGEVVVHPADDDIAVSHDDLFQRARPLTDEDITSGKYSILDIVLSTPGYDINYPDNDIGDYYREIMATEHGGGLDPGVMRRSSKDFSLSGSYRPFMARAANLSVEVCAYADNIEQLVKTDLDKMNKARPERHEQRSGSDGRRNDNSFFNYQGGTGRNDRGRGGRVRASGNRGRGGWRAQRDDGSFYSNTSRHGGDISESSEPHSRLVQDVRKESDPNIPTMRRSSVHPSKAHSSAAEINTASTVAPAQLPIDSAPVESVSDVASRTGNIPATGILAWQNYGAILRAQDTAWQQEQEALRKNMRPEDVRAPVIVETFRERNIETGKLTGRKQTTIHQGLGCENDNPETESLQTEKEQNKPARYQPMGSADTSAFGLDGAGDIDMEPSSDPSVVDNTPALIVPSAHSDDRSVPFEADKDRNITESETKDAQYVIKDDSTVVDSPTRKRPSNEISKDLTVEDNSSGFVKTARLHFSGQDDLSADTTETIANTELGIKQEKPSKVAVILEFSLGPSQYATMALRELCKAGGVQLYKPDYSAGR